ncbi:DUF1648 domain-containing protein [Rubrobacter marinus]|uniref:DUF1648 domain-containing protein n=1 Tax=Rubrobacter marinus TaxID=2653852 RepID=UPI00389B01AF
MFVLAAVVWSSAPDRIPVHWGLSGSRTATAGRSRACCCSRWSRSASTSRCCSCRG